MHDLVACHSGVAQLAVLLGALARGEDACGHRARTDELAHRAMHPSDVEQVKDARCVPMEDPKLEPN